MSVQDLSKDQARPALAVVRACLAATGGAICRLGEVIASASAAAKCARETERLFALSDEQLAELGLTRDQIVHHTFARYLHQ